MFIKVPSSQLKRALHDVKALNPTVVSFTTEGERLIVTAGSSVMYEDYIDITSTSSDYMDTVANVQYLDISDLLGEKDEVKLEFTGFSVELRYRSMSMSLAASDSIVQRPEEDNAEKVVISDRDSLKSALTVFKGLGIFQKTLQMDRPLQLFDTYGVVQYPTAWVRVRSSGITNVITKEQANIIATFDPTHCSMSSVITLYREDAKLILPVVPVPDNDEFKDLLGTMETVGIRSTKGLLRRVKVLSSTLGVCDCSVYVGESTLYFAVTKNTLRITDDVAENVSFSFDTRLEYMVAVLNLIGSDSDMEILEGKDSVCFRNSRVAIILSTGR